MGLDDVAVVYANDGSSYGEHELRARLGRGDSKVDFDTRAASRGFDVKAYRGSRGPDRASRSSGIVKAEAERPMYAPVPGPTATSS